MKSARGIYRADLQSLVGIMPDDLQGLRSLRFAFAFPNFSLSSVSQFQFAFQFTWPGQLPASPERVSSERWN